MDFQKLLDPDGARQKEFKEILEIVAAGTRPKADYSSLGHSDLIGLDFLRDIFEIQTSYMLLLRTFGTMYCRGWLPRKIKEHGLSLPEVIEWGHTTGPKQLYEAFCSYPHRGLVTLFMDLKLEQPYLNNEFTARLTDKPFESEMVLLDWGGLDREKELLKAIKYKSKWARKPDHDVKSNLGQIWEYWREPSGAISEDQVSEELPEFPSAIEMLPAEKDFWEGPLARAWRDGRAAFLRQAIPILAGHKGNIPERVWRKQRTEWETVARREKIAEDWQPDIELELYNNAINGSAHPDFELSLDVKRTKEILDSRIRALAKKTPVAIRGKIETVAKMHLNGISARQIAKGLGIDRDTVNKMIKNLGLPLLKAVPPAAKS